MDVTPAEQAGSKPGPAEWFTGPVWMDEIGSMPTEEPVRALHVRFAPGARTAWHTHTLGQVFYVVDGIGRTQAEGEPVREVRPGDAVRTAAGERHWHGAAPGHAMGHVALSGGETVWGEHVTDEEYLTEPQ